MKKKIEQIENRIAKEQTNAIVNAISVSVIGIYLLTCNHFDLFTKAVKFFI